MAAARVPGRGWRLIAAGASLMLLGGAGFTVPFHITVPSGITGLAVLVGGVGVFALGWVLVGAGLRPRGSARWGAILAIVAYFGIGLAWAALYGLVFGFPRGPVSVTNQVTGFVTLVLLWPWHATFMFGWFGLGPG